MLRGEFRYTLDEKGRVVLPPPFRRELGETVIVTRGFDNCIWVYSKKGWAGVEKVLRGLPLRERDFQRFLFAAARDVEVDRQGRISLPETLREYAAINKDVVVTGMGTRLEVWSEARWKEVVTRIQRQAVEIAEKIDVSL